MCDELLIEKAEEIIFVCDKKELQNEDNLSVRAARLFFSEKNIKGGAFISLIKNIPTEAGLGGGSADCAAVLYALNRIYGRQYSDEQLLNLALKLGADVPFCLVGGCVRANGVGEQFGRRYKPSQTAIAIIKPPFGISTKQAFSRYDGKESGFSGDEFAKKLELGILHCKDHTFNIFERLATECQQIEEIKQRLVLNGAVFALLSGSGSAVFGVFEDIISRDNAVLKLQDSFEVYSAEFVEKGIIEI